MLQSCKQEPELADKNYCIDIPEGSTALIDDSYCSLKNSISDTSIPADSSKALFESYFMALFPQSSSEHWGRLNTEQLQTVYRSLMFYYYCTPETQPDGGWYGNYWKDRINDNPQIDSFKSNWTNIRNEVFLFDDVMDLDAPAPPDSTGISTTNAQFWGNRMFLDYTLSSLRRGMRNSPQVLNGNAMHPKYGLGGYPDSVYLEMLSFPKEHFNSRYPQGCIADTCTCPPGDSIAKDFKITVCDSFPELCRGLETWFYPSQGNGMFWNIGNTANCYNYIDAFLNCPPGVGGLLEPVPGKPDSSLHNILVYLSRKAVPKGQKDPRTGLPGLCNSNNCNKSSFYGEFSLDKQLGRLMGKSRYWSSGPSSDSLVDNRRYITGWTDGKWYGYPAGHHHYPDGIAPYGLETSEDNPFIYTDAEGNEVYRTWYGKPFTATREQALIMVSEMYSAGDTGWEDAQSNWPFGSYFSYGEDLGVGKYWVGQVMTAPPYNCTTVQFTMTPTSLSSSYTVMPCYDFELMYFQESGESWQCVCAEAKTMDPTADFDSDTPGLELLLYAMPFKGALGGFLTKASNPQPFNGMNIGLSNFTSTTSKKGTFNPFLPNEVSGKNNALDYEDYID